MSTESTTTASTRTLAVVSVIRSWTVGHVLELLVLELLIFGIDLIHLFIQLIFKFKLLVLIVFQIFNVSFQKFITPLLLNFVLVNFRKTSDDSFQQLDFLIIGLTKFFETFLQDVVSKLTLNNLGKIIWGTQLVKNFMLHVCWCFFDTDFNELGRVFVLRKLDEIPFHLIKNLFVCLEIKPLKNFRYNKISEFILHVSKRIFQDFTDNYFLGVFVFGALD